MSKISLPSWKAQFTKAIDYDLKEFEAKESVVPEPDVILSKSRFIKRVDNILNHLDDCTPLLQMALIRSLVFRGREQLEHVRRVCEAAGQCFVTLCELNCARDYNVTVRCNVSDLSVTHGYPLEWRKTAMQNLSDSIVAFKSYSGEKHVERRVESYMDKYRYLRALGATYYAPRTRPQKKQNHNPIGALINQASNREDAPCYSRAAYTLLSDILSLESVNIVKVFAAYNSTHVMPSCITCVELLYQHHKNWLNYDRPQRREYSTVLRAVEFRRGNEMLHYLMERGAPLHINDLHTLKYHSPRDLEFLHKVYYPSSHSAVVDSLRSQCEEEWAPRSNVRGVLKTLALIRRFCDESPLVMIPNELLFEIATYIPHDYRFVYAHIMFIRNQFIAI